MEDRIPGTQTLFSPDILSAAGRNVLILRPAPSRDPEDPLNWSSRRKALAAACTTIFTFFNGFSASNLYSILMPLSEARPALTLATLNAGTGYLFLLAGLGLFFWQPLALQYGKRPVYLMSLLGLLCMNIWGVYCTTQGQWYARSILTGFFASPIEALPEASVADLYFTHERGRYMALYAAAVVGSNFFAPVICGFIEQGMGWRWVFWWTVIFVGLAIAFLFFAMEETNFDRPTDRAEREASAVDHALDEKHEEGLDTFKGKSYWKKLALKDVPRPFALHKHLQRQVFFLAWPIPLYAGFAYGSCLIWFNVLNATSSSILSSPPYNFKPSIVGLCYVAPLIGVAIATALAGPLSDMLAVRLARRAGGTAEPEHRLPLFALASVAIPLGLLLWGLGAAAGIHWAALLVAMAFLAFQNAVGAALAVTYLVDTYRDAAGDALTALIVVRNLMSFAVGYGITPWIAGMGLARAFGLAAGVGFAASLAWLPMLFVGKPFRRRSARRYWRMVGAPADADGQ